jgi:hypothetical protein
MLPIIGIIDPFLFVVPYYLDMVELLQSLLRFIV